MGRRSWHQHRLAACRPDHAPKERLMAAQPPEAPEDGQILDPTPDSADIDRGITPITDASPAKSTGALALAGAAMVIGIIWVNADSGSSNDDSEPMKRSEHEIGRATVRNPVTNAYL